MAANANVTNTAQFSTVTAREIDFVTRFSDNWQNLQDILGIMKPIRLNDRAEMVPRSTKNHGRKDLNGEPCSYQKW